MSKSRVDLYEEILPDGRCKYRLPYVDTITGKNRTLSVVMASRSASNYKLALRVLQEKLDRQLLDAAASDPTLRELADLYYADREPAIRASTMKRNRFSIDQVVSWLGEGVRLSALSVPYIKKKLRENCPRAVTYNENLKRFKALLRWAYFNEYLESSQLADKLRPLPDQKRDRIADKYLEKEELALLLDAASDKYWQLVIRFLALSGLRIGELISLKDRDIDSECIHVVSTFELSVGVVSVPKTADSIRDVYLRPELLACVREIRSFMRLYKFERGIRSDLFICGEDGGFLNYNSFRYYLGKLSAGVLDHRISPHALRHTAASLLIADGVPLDVVSRMLGHTDSAITREIYVHITQKLKTRDQEILAQASML